MDPGGANVASLISHRAPVPGHPAQQSPRHRERVTGIGSPAGNELAATTGLRPGPAMHAAARPHPPPPPLPSGRLAPGRSAPVGSNENGKVLTVGCLFTIMLI